MNVIIQFNYVGDCDSDSYSQSSNVNSVTKRSYTVHLHKYKKGISFELFNDNGDFVTQPNRSSQKYLKTSGISIENLVKNGDFTKHGASITNSPTEKKRKRTQEEKDKLPKKTKPIILKRDKDLEKWQLTKEKTKFPKIRGSKATGKYINDN